MPRHPHFPLLLPLMLTVAACGGAIYKSTSSLDSRVAEGFGPGGSPRQGAPDTSSDSIAGPSAPTAVFPMPDTWDRTLTFLEWTEWDYTQAEIEQHAQNYYFVWGGVYASWFRAANPQMNVGFYQPSFLDPYNARPQAYWPPYDTPQVRARTLRWWNTEADGTGHPDWILYQCDGVTPAYQPGDLTTPEITATNMPLDFTNPAVINWQFHQNLLGGQNGFTTLSADMFHLFNIGHACGAYRNGTWVQLFSGQFEDPTYVTAALEWARQMRALLHSMNPPVGLVVNFPMAAFSDEVIARVTANVDGILAEHEFTGYGDGTIEEIWLAEIRNMIAIQAQGKAFYSLNYVQQTPPSEQDIDWILSSFLMAREHSAYVIMTMEDGPRWPYFDYAQDIGHPCGPMRRAPEGYYIRDFSKGISVTNPSRQVSRRVTLPTGAQFRDLSGHPITGSSLNLGTQSGKVLLTSGPRC